MILIPDNFDVNDIVVFTTDHDTDVQEYEGTIQGFVTYAVARLYEDVAAYEAGCTVSGRADSGFDEAQDVEDMDFVLIKFDDDSIRAFSVNCIRDNASGTLAGYVNLKVHYTDADNKADILAMLRASGVTFSITA